ncbi:universal stress protein UspA [Photobacterium aphoticum]|uniref:Universal stress protein n=1 Tax=Photobacterium aphoticum TaxID=754436 RepID=A0A0J1GP60_9GAMM|nr:universal stress protein UspA [Photobacterium aphoticum]KLV01550.1 universal stress global response regulator UspA [Photobacterium aphoticum]PSU52888.1 universal stress protein UspA [Photobacterium aphoticum]GHA43342.1 universal stress protein [Photobacterium aphoticum]
MAYKHILVAIDLSQESQLIVNKAADLAKALDAKLSLIHIDVNYAELYTGLIDINLSEAQHRMADEAQQQLRTLAEKADYPVSHTLVGSGDLSDEICHAIDDLDIELVVCGHHQDFWSKILSSARQLINRSPVDMLMVPLK